jgi:hypothetical protein
MRKPEKFNNEEEQSRHKVEQLERLELLSDNDKKDILLIWRGLKLATEFEYGYSWDPTEEEKQLADEEIEELEKVVEDLGLHIHISERSFKEAADKMPEGSTVTATYAGHDRVRVYVGCDKESVEKIENAYNTYHIENSGIVGKLSGYPESAINAYMEATQRVPYGEKLKEMMYSDSLPEEIREEDFAAFVQFFLSRKNWREEIKTVKKWAEEIKKTAPALYERIVKDYKERNTWNTIKTSNK